MGGLPLTLQAAAEQRRASTYTFTDGNGSHTGTVTLTEYNDTAHAQSVGFVFTVDTTKPGTSNSNTITLPVNSWIDRDEQLHRVLGRRHEHDIYRLGHPKPHLRHRWRPHHLIVGEFAGLAFNNGGDCQKLTGITNGATSLCKRRTAPSTAARTSPLLQAIRRTSATARAHATCSRATTPTRTSPASMSRISPT